MQILSAPLEECACCSQNQVFPPNLKLARQSREGLILNRSQAVWFGLHSDDYDQQTTAGLWVLKDTFLMLKALIPAPFGADQVLVSRLWVRFSSPLALRNWPLVQSLYSMCSPCFKSFEQPASFKEGRRIFFGKSKNMLRLKFKASINCALQIALCLSIQIRKNI